MSLITSISHTRIHTKCAHTGGTSSGNASGFRLSTLQQLKMIKSADGKSSLLQYIVELVAIAPAEHQHLAVRKFVLQLKQEALVTQQAVKVLQRVLMQAIAEESQQLQSQKEFAAMRQSV